MPNYPKGLITKTPSAKAPDFIVANLAFKASEFAQFMHDNAKNGWLNIVIKKSKENELYSVVDDYEPQKSKEVSAIKEDIKEILTEEVNPDEDSEITADSIPF